MSSGGMDTGGGKGGATGGDVYSQAAQGMTGAQNAAQAGTALYGTTGPISQGMGAYANPFENQVVQSTLGDIETQRRMQQSQNQASAIQNNAFGGSRQGVVESMTNAAAQKAGADAAGNLRYGGFNTAAQLAGQDVQNRMGAAGGLLSGAGTMGNVANQQFGMGQQIGQNQWAQGGLAQGMNQMLLDQGQGMFNQYVNQPQNMLALRNSAMGQSPLVNANTTTGTSQYNPGLFDYLSLGAQTYGMSKMGR